MKKQMWFLSRARVFCGAALVVAVLTALSCRTLSKLVNEPKISFNSVSVTRLSFSGADLLAKLNVENGNSFSIPFPEIDWKLYIGDASFLNGTVKNDKKIAANNTTTVEIPFHVPYEGLYKTIGNLMNVDEASYRVDIGMRFPIPVLENKTFSSSYSGSLPMLKMPVLSFGGVKFNSLTLNKVEFVLSWAVENKNAFAVSLDKLGYNFTVNGSSWAQGQTPAGLNLAARKTTQVPVTVSVNGVSLIRDIVTLAGSGKSAVFSCTGEASLRPAFEGLEALSLPFNFTGNTNFRN
ncbi:MAG: LEA type 2 family protein [Treponema sp.]|jgi:LEA14-like dessication related protein|nr:LEA type 2 family protein [Treponema sp.]